MDSSLSKIESLADKLVHWFQPNQTYVVALSGGVDSATVACAGKLSAANVFTATGVGPATSQQERRDAQTVAETLDIQHFWIAPQELLSPEYQRNDLRRCFHCKSHLFTALATRFPQATIITGTNFDDLSDYRPGLEAARNASVRAPLAELQIGKAQVRQLASLWNLHIADKPASPCLASRIAYGVEVTEERLARVEAAETYLKQSLGIRDCRVRVHHDELARIEVDSKEISKLFEADRANDLVAKLRRLGFKHITVDLAGQRSGSLNPEHGIPVVQLQLPNNRS